MMKSEFIERTGFEPTCDEYKEIEAEYMGCDIDKDAFCKQWKKNGGPTRLMRLRAIKIEELERKLNILDKDADEIRAERDSAKATAYKSTEIINGLSKELNEKYAKIAELEVQIAQYEAFKQAMEMMKVALGA